MLRMPLSKKVAEGLKLDDIVLAPMQDLGDDSNDAIYILAVKRPKDHKEDMEKIGQQKYALWDPFVSTEGNNFKIAMSPDFITFSLESKGLLAQLKSFGQEAKIISVRKEVAEAFKESLDSTVEKISARIDEVAPNTSSMERTAVIVDIITNMTKAELKEHE